MSASVAVLIPTKNRRNLLEAALTSVFNQTVPPEEVIVVNDGSTDDTQAFLEGIANIHPQMRVIQRNQSGGVNAARNQGIRMAKSDWIMFLDDDDMFFPNAVSLTKEKINELPIDFFLFYFNTLIKRDKEEYTGGFQFAEGQEFYDPTYEDVMTKYGLVGDCKPVFKKAVFESGDYWFPEEVNGFESLINKKLARDNKKIRYYRELSTQINLQTGFTHLSFSASAKNPGAYLRLHIKDIQDHRDFYGKYPNVLRSKYREMFKLALRAHDIKSMVLYAIKSL